MNRIDVVITLYPNEDFSHENDNDIRKDVKRFFKSLERKYMDQMKSIHIAIEEE